MLQWTNVELRKRGSREISIKKLYAYVGLEIAMSIVQIGSIIEYWETKPFSGHEDFCETMSHTDFQDIRAAIQFHPFDCFDVATMEEDPLYHSRMFINHFL